ncbi:tapasin-related protein isoform X2 [Genypterus blacodes]
MTLGVILFGYFVTFVSAEGVADVVLSCALLDEGGLSGMAGGALFTRTQATLVLRDVAVSSDQTEETLTPFIPPSVPDPDFILLEVKVSSPEIPNAEMLLHADCNEQEVMCEISRYFPRGSQETPGPAYFMVSISVEGEEFSTALILQTLPVEKNHSGGETLIQNKLGLPLSQSGSVLTEVAFLVFSGVKSVSGPLRSDVLLNCGFRQQEMPSTQEVVIEWRRQHRGQGQKVLEMKTRLDDAEGSTLVHTERPGSAMDVPLVASENNASMSLTKLRISDEGTYICTVSIGLFHAQQVIQLHITQPPHVSLSEQKLVLNTKTPQMLSCHCSKYYPLDAQMEWLSSSTGETEPTVLPHQGSLTSHRLHGDGTYSLTSHLPLPSSITAGTTITCRVSHAALSSPLSVSVLVEHPEPDSYWFFVGLLVITVLFFYQVMR